jgi:hypothetical protein
MIENKQQTAVEWYSDKLLEIIGELVNNFTKEQTLANHYALKQSKEMEKEQHWATWGNGVANAENEKLFQDHWNETYGGNK